MVNNLIDFVLHLDRHLDALSASYGLWIYGILFLIIFAETGFVVTPFLPGDSLLFAVGALAARGVLNIWVLLIFLASAAILGNTTNYFIGSYLGPKFFQKESRWFRQAYLQRAHRFYEKYGAMTIVFGRFVPIVRTFVPFVAGIGQMSYGKFMLYNIVGGVSWVALFLLGGYFFGNLAYVQQHFGVVVLAIIVISLLPAIVELARHRQA